MREREGRRGREGGYRKKEGDREQEYMTCE